MHFFTYRTSESYYSHMIAMLLIDDTLWARKQFATSLLNYDDAEFV